MILVGTCPCRWPLARADDAGLQRPPLRVGGFEQKDSQEHVNRARMEEPIQTAQLPTGSFGIWATGRQGEAARRARDWARAALLALALCTDQAENWLANHSPESPSTNAARIPFHHLHREKNIVLGSACRTFAIVTNEQRHAKTRPAALDVRHTIRRAQRTLRISLLALRLRLDGYAAAAPSAASYPLDLRVISVGKHAKRATLRLHPHPPAPRSKTRVRKRQERYLAHPVRTGSRLRQRASAGYSQFGHRKSRTHTNAKLRSPLTRHNGEGSFLSLSPDAGATCWLSRSGVADPRARMRTQSNLRSPASRCSFGNQNRSTDIISTLSSGVSADRTADIISTVEFDHTGDYLATGDKGGRVVLFERNDSVSSFF
ncbi:hypothetical protein L1887_58288 [Cichorium endivia]|nr:hypothetical protein L1887_58288 [Cichorium endivia]